MDGREELNHGKKSLPATNTFFEATDLQQHVEYQFWVTGSTRVGEGQSSRVAAQVPTNRVPARITSFGGHVVRPWRGSICHSNLQRGWRSYQGVVQGVHRANPFGHHSERTSTAIGRASLVKSAVSGRRELHLPSGERSRKRQVTLHLNRAR